jgi:hypothetical protein
MKWQCALIQPRLPDYPDGELSPFWRRRVEAHLKKCPDCRRELEELAAVVRLYQAEPLPDPGPAFWQEFEQELHLKLAQVNQRQQEPAPRLGRLPHYIFGAAALAGVVALAVYLGPFSSPTSTPKMAQLQEEAQIAPTQTAQVQEPPRARQEIAAAPEPPPAIAKTLPPEPNSTEKIKALADRLARPGPRFSEEAKVSLAAGKLESAPRPSSLAAQGLWPEDDFPSWDVDAVVADLSPEERVDLKRRLESRR